MHAGCARLFRRAKANDGAAADQARSCGVGAGFGNRRRDGVHVMAVCSQNLPSIGLETGRRVLGHGKVGAAVNGDAVIVKQHDQPRQAHMTGHRGGFMADAFHQAAVTGDNIGEVVDKVAAELGGEVMLGHRHADGVGNALAKRPCRGLDPAGMAGFRMACGDRAKLPEIADLIHGHVFIAGQVQQGVDQHRAVASRQDKPVTIRPVRCRRIELQVVCEQRGCRVRHTHRHARMSGFCRFYSVH